MVMVRQTKLEAPDLNKPKKDFEEIWEERDRTLLKSATDGLLTKRGRCSRMLTEMPS